VKKNEEENEKGVKEEKIKKKWQKRGKMACRGHFGLLHYNFSMIPMFNETYANYFCIAHEVSSLGIKMH
jgi:hypothetical protein